MSANVIYRGNPRFPWRHSRGMTCWCLSVVLVFVSLSPCDQSAHPATDTKFVLVANGQGGKVGHSGHERQPHKQLSRRHTIKQSELPATGILCTLFPSPNSISNSISISVRTPIMSQSQRGGGRGGGWRGGGRGGGNAAARVFSWVFINRILSHVWCKSPS